MTVLPPAIKRIEDIKGYEWDIDTKYYRATIQLCTTFERTIGDKQFADSVQGAVLLFNTTLVSILNYNPI